MGRYTSACCEFLCGPQLLTQLSLFPCYLEFNSSLLDSVGSDEDSGNEDVLDMEYSEAEAEELKRNAEV